jgi:hypothetical protein
MALHPLMDSTSPSHKGFRQWGNLGIIPIPSACGTLSFALKGLVHTRQERDNVFESDSKHLERAVDLIRRYTE